MKEERIRSRKWEGRKKKAQMDKKNPHWFALMLHQMEMESTVIEPLSSRTIGEIIQAQLSE